jgi:poly-gamma-glutamate synthesis protein (capsule biosynthesis protein)
VNRRISWALSLGLVFSAKLGFAEDFNHIADLQIFGDLFIPAHVASMTRTTATSLGVFAGTEHLLNSSQLNIANFEGVATAARVPLELKTFLLRMPLWVPLALKNAHIDAVTLANNHTLDFGMIGLDDSKAKLTGAGIESFGAGQNIADAAQPIFLPIGGRVACIFSMTRTLPASFWATERRGGTAFLDYAQAKLTIERCAKQNYFTIVIFHWGQEMIHTPRTYQVELARLAIDAGADVIIGHHPHVLQEIKSYKGKPIFYSIGNYAFGSDTKTSPQEGMAVRIRLAKQPGAVPEYELVPLNVQNSEVNFVPRLFRARESSPLDALVPKKLCKKNFSTRFQGTYYLCNFSEKSPKSNKNPWR